MGASAGGTSNAPALADFIVLNEEIAALARARMPLEAHLAKLGEDLPGKSGELVERIGRRMEMGETLSAAMDAECANLPAVYRAIVEAGAASGDLPGALESLVDTASRLDQMRRVTGLAILYPMMVSIVACIAFALVLTAVVPNFDWLYKRHFGPFARLAESQLAIGVITFVVPAAILLGAAFWWWRSGRVGGAASARIGSLSWLPWVRGAHRSGEAATLADLLRLLVERGVPLDRALRLAGEAVDDRSMRESALALADDVARGAAVRAPGEPILETRLAGFPPLIRLALRHTSDRRLMAGSLEQAATIYRERAIRAAQWYAEYLPVLLTIAVGGTLTAFFTLMVVWPYASMLHELSQANWK